MYPWDVGWYFVNSNCISRKACLSLIVRGPHSHYLECVTHKDCGGPWKVIHECILNHLELKVMPSATEKIMSYRLSIKSVIWFITWSQVLIGWQLPLNGHFSLFLMLTDKDGDISWNEGSLLVLHGSQKFTNRCILIFSFMKLAALSQKKGKMIPHWMESSQLSYHLSLVRKSRQVLLPSSLTFQVSSLSLLVDSHWPSTHVYSSFCSLNKVQSNW